MLFSNAAACARPSVRRVLYRERKNGRPQRASVFRASSASTPWLRRARRSGRRSALHPCGGCRSR
ncbi:hypothetical protein ACFPRL_12435 [Pseudoclavibacter helvolus]